MRRRLQANGWRKVEGRSANQLELLASSLDLVDASVIIAAEHPPETPATAWRRRSMPRASLRPGSMQARAR